VYLAISLCEDIQEVENPPAFDNVSFNLLKDGPLWKRLYLGNVKDAVLSSARVLDIDISSAAEESMKSFEGGFHFGPDRPKECPDIQGNAVALIVLDTAFIPVGREVFVRIPVAVSPLHPYFLALEDSFKLRQNAELEKMLYDSRSVTLGALLKHQFSPVSSEELIGNLFVFRVIDVFGVEV